MPQRKLVSFDWAIKRLLRSKANFGILEGFLSELLRDDIHILEILESESNHHAQDTKINCVDIKVRNQHDEYLIVEVQFDQEIDFLQRILFATSRVISEHMKESVPYRNISKVISINILYFDLGRGDDYIYWGTTNFTGLHTKHPLELSEKQRETFKKTRIDQIFPEYYLIKVNQFNDIARDTLDQWIYFLKNETIEDNFQAKGLKQAKEELDVLKLSEQARREYEAYVEERRYQVSMYHTWYGDGHMDGKKLGHKEGRKDGKLELLIDQAMSKFGPLPAWAEERLRNAGEEQLQVWSKSVLKAETLERWLD